MKTIIVGTDFSPAAANAVKYAADLATSLEVELRIVHISPIPLSFSEIPIPLVDVDRQIEHAKKLLKRIKEDLMNQQGAKIKISIEVRFGDILENFKEICERLNPWLVIVGTHGTKGFPDILLGNTAAQFIDHLQWPLIVVPPESHFVPLQKVGLACDFENVSNTVPFKLINELTTKFDAELDVLHVSDETIKAPGKLSKKLGNKTKYHFDSRPDLDLAITDFSVKNKLDMLIVLPKKHKLMHRIFVNSQAKRTALRSHLPVLTVHE